MVIVTSGTGLPYWSTTLPIILVPPKYFRRHHSPKHTHSKQYKIKPSTYFSYYIIHIIYLPFNINKKNMMALFTSKFANKRFLVTFYLSPFRSYFIISTRNTKRTILICKDVLNTGDCFPLLNSKIFCRPNC